MVEASPCSLATVDKVMAIPHLVTSIINLARQDRPTLARLMRTNKNIYCEAGPVLYHTVVVWEKTFESFFLGAFDAVNEDVSGFSVPICNIIDDKTHEHLHFPKFENKSRSHGANGVPTGLPLSKKELLSHVRVLTLGSHRASSCAKYYVPFLKYVTNVDVFRIADTPVQEFQTAPMCENILTYEVPGEPCPIISAINPRKLVLRNLSHKTIPLPPLWYLNDNTREVVVVLPTVEERLHDYKSEIGDPFRLFGSFCGQFNRAETIKVVFWPEWDESLATLSEARRVLTPDVKDSVINKKVDRNKPHPVDILGSIVNGCTFTRRLTEHIQKAPGTGDHQPRIEFYGISSLKLCDTKRKMLAEEYKQLNPALAIPDLHTLVKLKALRPETFVVAGMPSTGGRRFVISSCTDVKFYTIGNYMRHRNEAEISEWD